MRLLIKFTTNKKSGIKYKTLDISTVRVKYTTYYNTYKP